MLPRRVVIMGAAGRDFHDFNVAFRDDPEVEVIAFTATQIPGIAGRSYPPELAGPRYPTGIPIRPEADLEALHAKRLHLFGVSNKLRPAAERASTVRAFETDFLPYFADGRLAPVIDRIFPFAELPAAHAYFESNAMIGKVVVTLQP